MPPLNRCEVRRARWPHFRCTAPGWPCRDRKHERTHRWWGIPFRGQ